LIDGRSSLRPAVVVFGDHETGEGDDLLRRTVFPATFRPQCRTASSSPPPSPAPAWPPAWLRARADRKLSFPPG